MNTARHLPTLQDCVPLRARLSTTSCAARWQRAQEGGFTAEPYELCRRCQVGERNAKWKANGEVKS